jgi:hypothetical protein
MIKRRLTDRFELVSIFDPALAVLPDSMVSQYQINGRNIEDLDLKRCIEQPSIFVCEPLQVKHQYLMINAPIMREWLDLPLMTAWQIFRTHVKEAKNFDDKGKPLLEWEQDGPELVIKNGCHENVDNDVLVDIAQAIRQKAGHATINFMLPHIFYPMRIKYRLLHASAANTETATKTDS